MPMSDDGAHDAEQSGRLGFAVELARRSIAEYFDDRGPQLAASIAYHVLFSIFPLAIVLTGVLGIVVQLTGLQANLVDAIVRNVPGLGERRGPPPEPAGTAATSSYSALGLIGLIGLIWAASGMMAAVRVALNAAWDIDEARPFLKRKLIDIGLVFMVAVGALASIVATVAVRTVSRAGSSAVGVDLSAGWVGWVLGVLFPLVNRLRDRLPALPADPGRGGRCQSDVAGRRRGRGRVRRVREPVRALRSRLRELQRRLRVARRGDRVHVLRLPELDDLPPRGGGRVRVAAAAPLLPARPRSRRGRRSPSGSGSSRAASGCGNGSASPSRATGASVGTREAPSAGSERDASSSATRTPVSDT